MRYAIDISLAALGGYFLTIVIWIFFVMPHVDGGSHGAAMYTGYAAVLAGLFVVAPLGALVAGLVTAYLLRT
jgi:hypothetical protein